MDKDVFTLLNYYADNNCEDKCEDKCEDNKENNKDNANGNNFSRENYFNINEVNTEPYHNPHQNEQEKEKEICFYCNQPVLIDDFISHLEKCFKEFDNNNNYMQAEVEVEEELKKCENCSDYFGYLDFTDHLKICKPHKPIVESDFDLNFEAYNAEPDVESNFINCKKCGNYVDLSDHFCEEVEEVNDKINDKFNDKINDDKINDKFNDKINDKNYYRGNFKKSKQIKHSNYGKNFVKKFEKAYNKNKIKYVNKKSNSNFNNNFNFNSNFNQETNLIKNGPEIQQCSDCGEFFGKLDLIDHMKQCQSQNKLIEDEKLSIILSRQYLADNLVNDLQLKAITYVQEISAQKSNEAYPLLKARFTKMGIEQDTLGVVLKYIAFNAPIIIHFNPQKVMQFFLSDTHYRNQFETGTSAGTLCRKSRVLWENTIFNNIYNDAKDSERVKYGVLNIVNDPYGVKKCEAYGDSYLVLKNEYVRLRTTFASGDSSGKVELATCENYCHVLNTFNDNELRDVISVATHREFCLKSDNVSVYKEIQIHGPIQFSRDVSDLFLNQVHRSNYEVEKLAEDFALKNGINLVWMN